MMGDEFGQAPKSDEEDKPPARKQEDVTALLKRLTKHMPAPLPSDRLDRLRERILAKRKAAQEKDELILLAECADEDESGHG